MKEENQKNRYLTCEIHHTTPRDGERGVTKRRVYWGHGGRQPASEKCP